MHMLHYFGSYCNNEEINEHYHFYLKWQAKLYVISVTQLFENFEQHVTHKHINIIFGFREDNKLFKKEIKIQITSHWLDCLFGFCQAWSHQIHDLSVTVVHTSVKHCSLLNDQKADSSPLPKHFQQKLNIKTLLLVGFIAGLLYQAAVALARCAW